MNSQTVQAFYDMINGAVKSRIDATPMDLTIDAEINSVANVDIGEYKVEYQGNIFSAFVVDPTVTYNRGERVYVLVPQGDFSTKKVILGRSAYNNNLSDAQRQDMTNYFIEQGPNWVSGEEGTYKLNYDSLGICAVPTESKDRLDFRQGDGARWQDQAFRRWPIEDERGKEDIDFQTRYPVDYYSDDELANIDSLFQNYAKSYEWLKISANFNTRFLRTHAQGKYSLRCVFIADNPRWVPEDDPLWEIRKDEKRYELVEFDLGFPQFIGAPYELVVSTPQKGYYSINPGELRGLYKLYLMQDGSFQCDVRPTYDEEGNLQYLTAVNSVLDENNIICDNIDIRFCKKLNMLDTLYYAWIEMPQGETVYDAIPGASNGRGMVDLIPRMVYNGGQGALEVTEDCRIEWFREDLSVLKGTPEEETRDEYGKIWTDYTGPGWRPVTDLIERNDTKLKVSNSGVLTVQKAAVAWQWRFKVVLIYNGEVYGTAIATVKNRDSKYDLFLERYSSQNSNQSFLRINDNNALVGHDTNPSTGAQYVEWFGSWYVQLPDESYGLAYDEAYYLRGPLNITPWMIYDSVTFRVACYDPYQVLPSDGIGVIENGYQVEEIGYLELTIVNTTNMNLLIDWVGRKAFNYTALGKAYPTIGKQEFTLQPKLKFADNEGTAYDVVIIAPDGAILGSRAFYNQSMSTGDIVAATGVGHKPIGSMMKDMWVDSENVVHFKVEQELEPTATKNTLIARVHSIRDDLWYEQPCEVAFTKDGQQGTQGTGWTAPIDYTNKNEFDIRRFNGETMEYYTQAAQPYTMRLGLPTYPLVIKRTIGADGRPHYVDTGTSAGGGDGPKVFLRPFPTKDGKDLMSLIDNEGKKFKIVTHWDVRYPQSFFYQPLRGCSFLKLVRVDDNAGHEMVPGSGGQAGQYHGTNGETDLAGVTSPRNAKGMQGMTVWAGYDNGNQEINKTYGAVRVIYDDSDVMKQVTDRNIQDILAAGLYQFVVKATVDIFANEATQFNIKGDEDGSYGSIPELEPSDGKYYRVKSFTSYMPIDIFVIDADSVNMKFDPFRCSINWPIDIQFDSKGYNPEVIDQYLEFYYGYFPDTQTKENGEFMVPRTMTPLVETVEEIQDTYFDSIDRVDDNHTLSTLELPKQFRYRLRPKSHMNWQEGTIGCLATTFTKDEDKQIPGGTFYRNQYYYMNAYDNVDINSWDGQGIDINEDNGTIFAPTIGAGYKAPLTNKFSGVLMGVNSGFPRATEGINQLSQAGADEDEQQTYPYMTGLFGYQAGVSSFGLLENGTAFFGRADRGGRIIIDGYNATIYGGANGVLSSPKIGDEMWNNMRITLVDLSHATSDIEDWDGEGVMIRDDDIEIVDEEGNSTSKETDTDKPVYTSVQGVSQGFSGKYFGDDSISDNDDPYETKRMLPWWYAQTWYSAYIKPKGQIPYFLIPEMAAMHDKEYEPKGKSGVSYNGHELRRLDTSVMWKLEDMSKDQIQHFKDFEDLDNTIVKNRGYSVNYWNPTLEQIRAYMGLGMEEMKERKEKGISINLTGFGPSRASTTPAIEIGQHPPGLMPGLIPWDASLEDIFKDLYIPGDRNFMVTYDGTMWAMNGVFLGNVIGSNIIGGRMRGVEIGIGDKPLVDTRDIKIPDNDENWSQLQPPTKVFLYIKHPEYEDIPTNAFIDRKGNALFKNVAIFGGCIHIGSFHIMGEDGCSDSNYNVQSNAGRLFQYGDSDFVGNTHFYGGVGIGPNLGQDGDYPDNNGQSFGNFFQTNGIAALGIIAPNRSTKFHAFYCVDTGRNKNVFKTTGLKYAPDAKAITPGDPKIEEEADSVERTAMFGVNTAFNKPVTQSASSRASSGGASGGSTTSGPSKSEFKSWVEEYSASAGQFCYAWGASDKHDEANALWARVVAVSAKIDPVLAQNGYNLKGQSCAYMFSDVTKYLSACSAVVGILVDPPTQASSLGTSGSKAEGKGYQGHFWPMAFRYVKSEGEQATGGDEDPTLVAVHGYLTTMNLFQSRPFTVSNGTNNEGGTPAKMNGGNYFRVGPWGQEGLRYYICTGWQDEDTSKAPTVDRKIDSKKGSGVRGYMGLVNRAGDGTDNPISYAIGMTSWGKAPIIFASDSEFAVRSKNSIWFYGNSYEKYRENDLDQTSQWGDHMVLFGGGSVMPSGAGGSPHGYATFRAAVAGVEETLPRITLQISNGTSWADEPLRTASQHTDIGISPASIKDMMGLSMDPFNSAKTTDGGYYIYSRSKDIHIIKIKENEQKLCYDKKGGITEALFKDDEIVLYASKKITLGWGEDQSAHITDESEWKHAAVFKDDGITVINNGEGSEGSTGSGGGGSSPPTPAQPGDKKYCIYLGAKDNTAGIPEITWQTNFISVAAKQVWISGGGSPAHSPSNFMLFAQSSVDMRGAYATPDNQFHIYARFG